MSHIRYTTETVTPDRLRPGDTVTSNSNDPEEPRGQAVVVSATQNRSGTITVRFSPVLHARDAFETECGPGLLIHRVKWERISDTPVMDAIREKNEYKAKYIEDVLIPAVKEFHPSLRRAYVYDNALPMAEGGRGVYDSDEAAAIREHFNMEVK